MNDLPRSTLCPSLSLSFTIHSCYSLIFEGIKPIYLANCIHYLRVQVDVSGAVSREDLYVIVAEYYQPNHPALTLRVNVSNTVSADRAGGDQVAATDFIPGK